MQRRRNVLRKIILLGLIGVSLALVLTIPVRAQDPLPSWNDGASKQAIVCREGGNGRLSGLHSSR
jgi:hypothetical protein